MTADPVRAKTRSTKGNRMRLFWLAAAMLIAGPARADVTAHYTMGPEHSAMPAMVVEVNGRGDARISMGNQMALVMLDGVAYLIQADLRGVYVARWDDLTALLGERIRATAPHSPALNGAGHSTMPAMPPFVERGTETVGGRTGTLWSQRVDNGHGPPRDGIDMVISSDPDLAPLGRVFARQFDMSLGGMRTMLGAAGPNMTSSFESMRALLARGAPLRMAHILRLENADTHPIPASEFVLPSAPLTRAQLEARLGWPPAPAAPAEHPH